MRLNKSGREGELSRGLWGRRGHGCCSGCGAGPSSCSGPVRRSLHEADDKAGRGGRGRTDAGGRTISQGLDQGASGVRRSVSQLTATEDCNRQLRGRERSVTCQCGRPATPGGASRGCSLCRLPLRRRGRLHRPRCQPRSSPFGSGTGCQKKLTNARAAASIPLAYALLSAALIIAASGLMHETTAPASMTVRNPTTTTAAAGDRAATVQHGQQGWTAHTPRLAVLTGFDSDDALAGGGHGVGADAGGAGLESTNWSAS